MALLLPTFGKRPQEERGARKKRATTTGHATERTSESAIPPAVPMPLCDAPDDATEPTASSQLAEQSQSTGATGGATEAIAAELEASMTLDDVVTELSLHDSQDAQAITNAVWIIQEGKQSEIRKFCQPWGVQLREKKASGKQGNRPDHILKQELKIVLTKRTIQLKNQSCNSKRDVKDATSPGGTATEHARADFAFEDAVADALQRIKASSPNLQIMARVVDHACHSETCISHRIAAMCREASWKTSVDLRNDQPTNACGYIAADAVCRLRETALADANSWHHSPLPDYSQLQCIERGNKALHKGSDDRILEADQVNRLVRHYSHLDRRQQAAEEWWGGAIAIDHFLAGLPSSVQELTTDSSDKQHRWRVWIVNTQTSKQQGSHWFTVVLGTQTQLLQSIATQDASDSCASQPATDCIASSSNAGAAPSSAHQANNYPNLFEIPDTATTDMINWAHANAMHQPAAAWLRACGEWDSAVATKDHHHRQKRRKLCKDHDIPFTRENNSNEKLDATMTYIRRELINRIQQIRTTRSMHRFMSCG